MSETFDPKRRLCPDGSCIGVIGPDGRCSVCGRTGDGRPRVLAAGGAGFDPQRRLCDDGSCVGVVGADGRCGVCGKEAGAAL